ncbi:hypothetical protein [Armatimonas sp.]|uniref:hypothetical protein n=1 Tax=Armatimonas sp. TaxID=1872638 RepID=UPI00286CC877|nr:hypothetical protein [Armatimonas sp.]
MTMVGVMILLFLLLAFLLISMLAQGRGGDVSSESKSALNLTRRRGELIVAQTLAESGIRLSLQWLIQQPSSPVNTSAFGPSSVATFYGGTVDANGWTVVSLNQGPTTTENATVTAQPGTIKVRFYPYATNATSNRKMYGIECTGEYLGYSYTARIFIRQNSFARYAYFSDTAPTGWWVSGSTRFQGPVHVNGVDGTGNAVDPAARINILWKANDWSVPYSDDWIFTYPDDGYFTTAMSYSQINWQYSYGSGAYYYDPNWWTPYWENITAANRAPKTDQPIILMPTATTSQKNSALGASAEPAVSFIGAFVPVSGSTTSAGVYIGGDVKDMNLSYQNVSGHDDQVIEVIQNIAGGEQLSRLQVSLVNNQTVVTVSTRATSANPWSVVSTNTYTGVTNSVIYVSGNIGSQTAPYTGGLSGAVVINHMSGTTVVRPSSWMVVTDSTKVMNLDGGIVYKDLITDASNPNNLKSNASAATDTSGTLGLVAGRFRVPEQDGSGATLDNLTIHAVCMAYDTFTVVNPTTRAPGVINLIGGYIVKNNTQLGIVQLDGTVNNGFIFNRNYDQRIAENPPPDYPVADRSYQIMSFQKVNTTLN